MAWQCAAQAQDLAIIGNWLSDLLGEQTLDNISNALILAYGWARDWQVLLAGLVVLVAGLIVARAIRKGPATRAPQQDHLDDDRTDLRREPGMAALPMIRPEAQGDLVHELEQLRSLIRSALSAFTLTAEKENSPVLFLCQRVARLRPERFPLPGSATHAQQRLHAEVLEHLETLRQQLKKEVAPAEMSGTLVQLNTSARNLIAALPPQAPARRQAGSEKH